MFRYVLLLIIVIAPNIAIADHLEGCFFGKISKKELLEFAEFEGRFCAQTHTDNIGDKDETISLSKGLDVYCPDKLTFPNGSVLEGLIFLEAQEISHLETDVLGAYLVVGECQIFPGNHQ